MQMKWSISYLSVMLFLFSGWTEAQNKLKFNAEGHFKIVQITDMHISLQKGQSEVCYELIREAIETEKPDLIVFTGDQVTEYKPEKAWKRLVKQMEKSKVAWTMVFGNHDHEQGLTRDQIFGMVKKAPNCLMEKGNVKGVGNFILGIEGSTSDKEAATLYFMDSHANCEQWGIGGYQWIDFSQIAWFIEQSKQHRCPSLVFLHIPLPEYNEALKGKIIGGKGEDICSPRLNSGLYTALKESGRVFGVFAGHDHENDFVGEYYGIALGYGRVSAGKNAYGNLSPGMRVIVLTEGKREFETYIRLKGGDIVGTCKYPDSFVKK